ncbi:MAG: cytochrome c biogenesis protein CcdA [Firmicutes bacterium]|jgi:cytochrome c-type biogenesis protein|nr:cytochrome c biogenesis protein CcdA [Bacillota bacterium]
MGEQLTLALVFGAGFLSFASPCVLPLLPSFLSYVCGLSVQAGERGYSWAERRRILAHTIAFVIGLSTVFLALGWSASLFGTILFDYSHILRWIGAVFIGIMGLKLLGVVSLPLLDREWRFHPTGSVSYVGSLLLGVAFAAGWTPCIGPILAGVLVLAGSEPQMALAYLAAYTVGLAVPFLLSALFLSSWPTLRRYVNIVQPVAGAILLLFAVLLATNWLTGLSTWFIGKVTS